MVGGGSGKVIEKVNNRLPAMINLSGACVRAWWRWWPVIHGICDGSRDGRSVVASPRTSNIFFFNAHPAGSILYPGGSNNEMLKFFMDYKGAFPNKVGQTHIFSVSVRVPDLRPFCSWNRDNPSVILLHFRFV